MDAWLVYFLADVAIYQWDINEVMTHAYKWGSKGLADGCKATSAFQSFESVPKSLADYTANQGNWLLFDYLFILSFHTVLILPQQAKHS